VGASEPLRLLQKDEVHALDFSDIRKILIRSTNWIGDAVMTTPAMGAVRAAFPTAEIVVAANPPVAELLYGHPACDRLLVYDRKGRHKGLPGLWRFSREIWKERFDLAILFQNAFEAAVLTLAAGIHRRAGYRTDGRGILLTHGVPVGRAVRRLHHTDYYLNMLGRLGIRGGDGRLHLNCTAGEKAWAESILGGAPWAAVNPGATYGSAKRWYPERFAEAADRIAETYGFSIVLVGGPGETAIGHDIEEAMPLRPLNLIGKTSIRQMMAILSAVRLMVTNDSGPMHVAAAFGTPIVALFGPTDHTTTSPLMPSFRIVRKPAECAPCLKRRCPTDHRCMDALSAADVLEAVDELVRESSGRLHSHTELHPRRSLTTSKTAGE
jgi:heptosyltransferase II